MFIFDEIECLFESVSMFVEEKVNELKDPTSWPDSSYDEDEEETVEENVEEDEFDRYLRNCALDMLNIPVLFADNEDQASFNNRNDSVRLKVKTDRLNSMYGDSEEADKYAQMIKSMKILISIIKKCGDKAVHKNNIGNAGVELVDWTTNLSENERQNLFYEIEQIEQLLSFMVKHIQGKLQEKDIMTIIKQIENWRKSVKDLKGDLAKAV